MNLQLFKILVDDKPCHGGNGAYPPIGEWSVPVPNPKCCERGYHLTSEPLKWYKPKSVLYIAEGDGASHSDNGDKIAFERVRLVAKVTRETPNLSAYPQLRLYLALVERSNDRDADISWADLSGANLSRANLSDADLSGANLSGADLSGAYRPTDPPAGWKCDGYGYLAKERVA